MRDLPNVDAQRQAISRWLIKYGDRRPSEAATEVSGFSDPRRRKMFRNLLALKCIANTDRGWDAIAPLPTIERIALDDEIN